MKYPCPNCRKGSLKSEPRTDIVRAGFYRRKSDCKDVQRFRCRGCLKYFSTATFHPCVNQKKRQFNFKIKRDLRSGVSQRRIALNHHLSRETVKRKFLFLGTLALEELKEANRKRPLEEEIYFDDMESSEHTKLKPLSIPLVVTKRRRILGFAVARMPAKGRLSKISHKKYGPRKDERLIVRRNLFEQVKPFISDKAIIKSDKNPAYLALIADTFPGASYCQYKGQRGSVVHRGS